MKTHIVYVASYHHDQIEVSASLPEPRHLEGRPILGVPVTQGYTLTRLRIRADEPPLLPDGDITREQFQEWSSIFDPDTVRVDKVDSLLVGLGLGAFCVVVTLATVDMFVHGTLLEATVTNVGADPIGLVQVTWWGKWEQPRESNLIGRGFHFVAFGSGPPAKQLLSGESRKFGLLKPELQQCLSYAAALSPDQYYLTTSASLPGQTAVYEIARMPGEELAYMVEKLEEFLESEEPQ